MVVSDTRTEDIDEGKPLVLESLFDQLREVFRFSAEAASYKCCSGRESQRYGIDRLFNVAVRHRLRLHSLAAGRRSLTGGETVNLIIHRDVKEIDVSPYRVNEMISSNAEAVSIAASDDDM